MKASNTLYPDLHLFSLKHDLLVSFKVGIIMAFIMSTLMFSATAVHANEEPIVYSLKADAVLEIEVSDKNSNIFRVQDDRISDLVFFNAHGMQLTANEDTGEVYLRWKDQTLERQELTLYTESGIKQDLVLLKKDIVGQIIYLNKPSKPVQSARNQANLKEKYDQIVTKFSQNQAPEGFNQIGSNKPPYLIKDSDLIEATQWESTDFVVEVFSVRASTQLDLSEINQNTDFASVVLANNDGFSKFITVRTKK